MGRPEHESNSGSPGEEPSALGTEMLLMVFMRVTQTTKTIIKLMIIMIITIMIMNMMMIIILI